MLILQPGASMTYWGNVSWSLTRAQERVGSTGSIVTWLEDNNPYQILVSQVFNNPASGFRVAMDPETREFIPVGIQAALGANNTVEDGYDIVRNIRMIKSAAEIQIMRCICKATKAVLNIVQYQAIVGMTEDQLSGIVTVGLTTAGLTPEFALVLFAANAAFPHGTDQKLLLQRGNLILIDCGGSLYGYNSDISRTFPFIESALNDEQRNVWNTVQAAQSAAIALIAPGTVTCSQLDAAARQVVGNAGYGYDYGNFTHRLGHGIALQVHEEPYNVRGNNLTLRSGMTFTIEPGIYLPGVLGVRLEDIALVTDTGYEVFGPLTDSLENPIPPVS